MSVASSTEGAARGLGGGVPWQSHPRGEQTRDETVTESKANGDRGARALEARAL